MLELLAQFSSYCLIALIAFNLISSWLSSDRTKIWNPMTFISLVYIYYTLMPFFSGFDYYGFANPSYNQFSMIGALVSYVACYITFSSYNKYLYFNNFNNVFTKSNGVKIALVLFVIGFIGHAAYRGFSFSIFADTGAEAWKKEGDFEFYFSSLVSLSCATCSILISLEKRKKILIPVLLISLIIYIVAGFRYRIVMLFITMAISWHLYPEVKRINYKLLMPIAIAAYLFFGLMDASRQYSAGLNKDVVANYDFKNAKGASENSSVFTFSGYVMDAYQEKEHVYFQPFWCAITLPIPRSVFPEKPNADYVKNISTYEFGGAAFTYYAEAYMAFGWIGVILYGIFLGWFSKRVWLNYLNNSNNINSILYLGLFNGFTYVLISRGYMAQTLLTFVYFVVLPFWLARLFKKLFPSKF